MAGLYFIASYPRSGNTWTRMFLFSVMKLAGYLPGSALASEIDHYLPWDAAASLYRAVNNGLDVDGLDRLALRPAVHQYLAAGGHPMKMVKSHTLFGMAGDVPLFDPDWRGACYLVRNPLDVAPSLARLLNISVDDAISTMARPLHMSGGTTAELWGSWSQSVESWARDDVLVLRYEDLPAQLPRVVSHAGLEVSDDVVARALAETTLPNLEQMERRGEAFVPTRHGARFFGGGATLSYRHKLSPLQARRIIEAHGPTMERFGYLTAEALEFAEMKTPAAEPGAVAQ